MCSPQPSATQPLEGLLCAPSALLLTQSQSSVHTHQPSEKRRAQDGRTGGLHTPPQLPALLGMCSLNLSPTPRDKSLEGTGRGVPLLYLDVAPYTLVTKLGENSPWVEKRWALPMEGLQEYRCWWPWAVERGVIKASSEAFPVNR